MNPKNDQKARKQVLTIIITMVYAISIGSGLMLPWIINASADEYPEYPDDGYLYESLEGNVLITNRTMMTLNQTIAQSGSNVCLENVTWYFAEDFLIEEGAAVTAINSSFLPANDGWGGYNNLGSLSMENCTIMNTTTAVTSTDGTLSMNDCEIGNTQYGINVSGSDDPFEPEVISITNSSIRRCIEGVNLIGASAYITNNLFDGNQYGLCLDQSDSMVLNNTFKWSLYNGITYDSTSSPMLIDNIFDGKGPRYTYLENWCPTENLSYENYVIDVSGDLILTEQITFSLINSTFTAEAIYVENGSKFEAYGSEILLGSGLWVCEEAELVIMDSIVKAQNSSLPINVSLKGKSTVSHAGVYFLQGNPHDELTPWKGGIEIFTDDVSIENSTISHCSSSGICVYYCTPTLNNNTITDCGYAAIYWVGNHQPEEISPGDADILDSEFPPYDFGDEDGDEDYIPLEEAPNSTLEDLLDSMDYIFLDEMADYWLLINDSHNAEMLKFVGKDRRNLEFGVLSKGYKGNVINITCNANEVSPEENGYNYSYIGLFDENNATYTNYIDGIGFQFRMENMDVPDPNGTHLLLRNRFGWSGGAMYVEDDEMVIHMPGSTFSSPGISIIEPSSGEAEYIFSKPNVTYLQNGSEMSFNCSYYITLQEDFLYLDVLANLTSLTSAFDAGADEALINAFIDFGCDPEIENCPLPNGDVIEISHISDDEYHADDIYFQKYDSERNPIGDQICLYNGNPQVNIGELHAIPDENNNIMLVFFQWEKYTNDREIHFLKTDSAGNLIVSPKTLIDTGDLNIYLDAEYRDGDLFITWTNRPGNRTTMRQYGGVWDNTGNEVWSGCLVPDQLSGKGVVAPTGDSFYVEWSDGRFNSLGDVYVGKFSSMNGQSQGETRMETTVEADIPMEIMVLDEGTDETIHLLWAHTHSNQMTRLSYASVDANMDIQTEFTYLETYREGKYMEQERKATMISSEMSTDNIWIVYNQKQKPGNTVDSDLTYRIIDTGGNQITDVSMDHYVFDTPGKMNVGTSHINTYELTTYQYAIDFEDELGFISFSYMTETDGSSTADSHTFHILPDAGFTTSTEMVHVGEEITFDASDSYDLDGSIAEYQWDYYGSGDYHSYSGDTITSMAYDSCGKYAVGALITDDAGLSSTSQGEVLVIPNPKATMNTPTTVLVGEPVELDASSSIGYLDTCNWEIGDGSMSDGVKVEQVFDHQGNYPVELAVTDVLGEEATSYHVIRVIDPAIHRLSNNVIKSSNYGVFIKDAEVNLYRNDISDCDKALMTENSCVAIDDTRIHMSDSYDIYMDPGSRIVTVDSQYDAHKCYCVDESDNDGDGIPDCIEPTIGINPEVEDTDGDGVNDDEECAQGSDPNVPDSDGDGLGDDLEYPAEVRWYEAEDYAYNDVQRIQGEGLSGGAAVKTWTDLNTRNILTLRETELGEGWYKIYFRAKSDDEKTIMVGVEGGLLPVQTYLMSDYYDWYSTPEFEFYGDTLLLWMGTYTGVGTEYVDRICIAKTKEAVTRFSDGESEKELTYKDGNTAAVEGNLHVKIPVDKEIDRATVKLESISLCELVEEGTVNHALIRYGDPINLNFKFDQVDSIVYSNGADAGYDVYFDGERDGDTLTRLIKLTKDPTEQGNPLIYEGDPGAVDISQMPYTDAYESCVIGDTAVTFCVKLSARDYGKVVMPQGWQGGFDWYRYTLVDIVSGIGVEDADDLIYGEPKNFNYRFDSAESSLINGPDPMYDIYIDKTENGGIATYSVVLTKDPTEQGNPLIYDAGIDTNVELSMLVYTDDIQSVTIGTKTGEDHCPIIDKTVCLMMGGDVYVKMVFPGGHQGAMNWYRYQVMETESDSGSHGGTQVEYGDPDNLNYRFETDGMGYYSGADTGYDVYFITEVDGGVTTYSVKLTKDPTQQGNPLIYDSGTDTGVCPSGLSYTDTVESVATGTFENDVHYPLADKTICVKLSDDEYGKLVFPSGHQAGFQWYYYEMVENEINYGYCTNQEISYWEPQNLNAEFFPYESIKADGADTGYDIYLDVEEDGNTLTYSVKLTKDPSVEGNPRIYDAGDNTVINPTEVEYSDDIDSVVVGTNVDGVDDPEEFKTICLKRNEFEYVKLFFEEGHLGDYEWEQYGMESSEQDSGEHYVTNGDYYNDDNLHFRFLTGETLKKPGPDDTFDVYFRIVTKGGGCFDYEVALTKDPASNSYARIFDADTNTLVNPLGVEYADDVDSVVLGTLDGEQHIPIADKTVCVQMDAGKFGKLVFPNGHLEEDGTGTGFNWYYYEVRTITGAINVDIGDVPDSQNLPVPDDNLLDIGVHLEGYRLDHLNDADEDGMLEVPLSFDSNGEIEGKMLVKDLWIEYFNEMALGQITDPDSGDTDFDGLPDSRERNPNLWWFEAEHYASENELVEEVDHRDASNNKAVQGIAGESQGYPIPLVNLLKSEQLPVFSDGQEFQIYFRAKAIIPSRFQVEAYNSANPNAFEDWHLIGTEYRWYRTATFRPNIDTRFMTIEINAEREQFFTGSEPTCGIYLDKIAVLRLKDETNVYTGVDAFTVSDCMNGDTDEDGLMDGGEGGEIHEFEAEDLAFEGQDIIGDDKIIDFSDPVVLESSNGRYVKRFGIDDLLISPAALNQKLMGNLRGSYRLAARAKDSANQGSTISFSDDNVLPLETHIVNSEYRWYVSEEFNTNVDFDLEIKASQDSVMLDKIMIIKSTDLDGTGVITADGQATGILDCDMDRDDILDGDEVNDNVWWFEAEHHRRGATALEADIGASNSQYIQVPQTGDLRLLEEDSFRSVYPAGDYCLYARAGVGENYPRTNLYMHISADEDFHQVPGDRRYHTVSGGFKWYVSDVYHIEDGGRLYFQVATDIYYSDLKLDKIAVARIKDGDGTPTGAERRIISGPLDQDTDYDGANDGMERNDDVWWFEAENVIGGCGEIVEDESGSNGLGVIDLNVGQEVPIEWTPGDLFKIGTSLPYGSYELLIRARMADDTEDGTLSFICLPDVLSVNQVGIMGNEYIWYSTTLSIDEVIGHQILLTGDGLDIVVDKICLIRIEDEDGGAILVNPKKVSDQLDVDTDGEGLLDGEELNGFLAGTNKLYSHTIDRDSDDDGLVDSIEVGKCPYDSDGGATTTGPLDVDSDGDFLPDGWIDGWGYRWKIGDEGEEEGEWGVFGEEFGTLDGSIDFAGWLPHEEEIDGVTNYFASAEGEDKNLNGKADNWNNPNRWELGAGDAETKNGEDGHDTDDGGVGDGEEIVAAAIYNLDKIPDDQYGPLNPLFIDDDDNFEDWDEDGLINLLEDIHETDKNNPDTDFDGRSDGDEVSAQTDPLDSDSDDDGIPDGPGDGLINNFYPYEGCVDHPDFPDPWNAILPDNKNNRRSALDDDCDGDGMPDGWEYEKYFDFSPQAIALGLDRPVNPVVSDGNDDNEYTFSNGAWQKIGDSYPNYLEYLRGTEPGRRDSDFDGLLDGEEDSDLNGYITGGDGKNADWNGNGHMDIFETWLETDALNPDTDGDGLKDGIEHCVGYSVYLVDSHGIPNGIIIETSSSPLLEDTDGDGLNDWDEYRCTASDNPDTDRDGLLDGKDRPCDEVFNDWYLFKDNIQDIYDSLTITTSSPPVFPGELSPNRYGSTTEPLCRDTDGDDLIDGFELYPKFYTDYKYETDPTIEDCDEDGVSDGEEYFFNSDPWSGDTDWDGLTDKTEWDGWNVWFPFPMDFYPRMGWKLYYNSWEEIHGFFVWGYHIQSNPNDFDGDSDDDGLSDKEEMDLGLNPIDPDTDCDGLLDFVEINGVSEHSNLEQVGSYEWNREYGVNHNSLLLNVNKEVMAIDPNDNENDKLIFYEWPGYPEKICPKYSDDLHKEYQWIADGDNIQDQKDVAIGDFDMDGYIDEVVSIDKSPHGTDNMIFYEWNWDQDNTPEVIYNEKILPPFDNQIAIAVGDFNNDGYLNEIVTIDDKAPGEQDHLIFYRWQDYPVFSPEFLLRWEITGTGYEDVRNQKDIAVGDFDEDGFIDDIVTIDDDNGNDNDNLVFYEWKNYNEYNDPNSDLYHNSNALPTPKEKWDISGVKNQKAIAVCDLDNDGYLNEIVTIDDNGEGNDNLVFYDFPNYPNFWPEKILKWDIPGDIKNQNSIAVGDFDADGHIDDIVTIDDDASDEDNLIFYHWDKDDYLSYRDDDNLDKLPELVQKWENIPDANDQLGIVVGDFKQIEVKGHSTNTVFCNIPTTFWGEILPEDGCENPSDYTWTWDFDIETDTPDFATDDIDNDKDGDVDEQDEGELVDWDGDGITDNDGDAKGQFPTYTYKFNPDLHYPHTYKVKVTSSNGREGDSYPNNGETFNIIVKDITTESKLPDSDFNGLWDGDEYLGDRFLGDKLGLYNSLVCEPISQNRFNGYNFDEYSNPNHYITNPKVRDTDGDGISDRGEMDSSDDYTTHPLIIDTDGDTLPDGWLDINGNGQMDLGEFEDRNRDGYVDIGDWSNGDGPGETNPTLVDTDGGGDSDDFELSVGLDPLDYYSEDPDKDGLTSFEELNIWGPYPCPGGVEQRSHMLEQNWDEDRYLDSVDPNPLIENDPPLIYNLVELDRWVYGIGFSVDEISNYEVSCTVWVPEELEGDDCPLEISSDGDDWEILFPVFLTPVEGWYTEEALIRITDDSNHDGEYNYDHTDDIPDDNYCTIHMIFDPGNGNLDGGETTISDRFWAASDISWAFSDTPPVPSRYHNIGLGEIGGVFGLLFGFIAIITDEGDIVEPDISLSDQYIWKFKNTQGRTIFLERGFIEDKVVGEDTYYRGYGFDYIVNGPTAPYIIPPENEDLWTISLIHIIKNILSESNEVETDYVGNQIYHYRDVNDDDWQLTISNGIIIDLLRI